MRVSVIKEYLAGTHTYALFLQATFIHEEGNLRRFLQLLFSRDLTPSTAQAQPCTRRVIDPLLKLSEALCQTSW